jgi:hypothetical protein
MLRGLPREPPERPRALRWRPIDPVGYQVEPSGEGMGAVAWCHPEEIDELRGRSFEDPHQLKRSRELIALQDRYEAADKAAEIASGCRRADDISEALHEQASELCDRILELRPSTLAGYRAMASAVVNFCISIGVTRPTSR